MNVIESSSLACCSSNAGDDKADNMSQSADRVQKHAELLRYDWKDKPDQALLNYINSNMAKLAELLKEMGVIDEVPNPLPVIRSRHFNQKAPYGNSKLLPSSFTFVRPG